MFSTNRTIEILDHLDHINDMVKSSEEFKTYIYYKHKLEQDNDTQMLIKQFNRLKEDFEEVERFGRYHPDYKEKRKEIRLFKKKVDMDENVIEFRRAEYVLQSLLDEILYIIGKSVSDHANVVSTNPFFASGESNCMTGGGCSCAS
ncbi:YlbF family regulator [Nosocomiicoccus massiliensis]|uniref:YlbF family regulator n=1 Tax=Nosocomiicoccus massiliensis TaxID=1232430 RepID=UPI0004031FD3|nr:YlbF family regulator [Nosocomiicoccus massiliensis]